MSIQISLLDNANNTKTILAEEGATFVKQWHLIMVSTLLAMLPIIILYIFAQKYIVKGMVEGSIK